MLKKIMLLIKGQMALWSVRGRTDPKQWIFSSVNNTEFNYNSKYLFLYVKEHFKQIHPYYVVNDREKREELEKKYGRGYFIETNTIHGMCKAMRCGVWFTSAGLPVYAVGTGKHRMIINLWHGVPLKKIVLMEAHRSKLENLYYKYIFSDNYWRILTTSEELVPVMAQSFGVKTDKIKVLGQPRNDMILEHAEERGRLADLVTDLLEYKKAILYAPTYRDDGSLKLFPFEDMDIGRLENYLEDHQILLCLRAHIEDTGICSKYVRHRIIDLSSDTIEDIAEYLPEFDLLITDYSSIYIDFLLLDRPVIFLPYDKEVYLSERGMNFEYDAVTPGDKPENFEAFLEAVQRGLYADVNDKERRRVNEKLNQVTTPCSEKICRMILNEME